MNTITDTASADFTPDERNAIFRRLRTLKDDCGYDAHKHGGAIVLITACILEGFNTRARIVGALRSIGLNPSHVAIVLNEATGKDPNSNQWQRSAEGEYSLHPDLTTAPPPVLSLKIIA